MRAAVLATALAFAPAALACGGGGDDGDSGGQPDGGAGAADASSGASGPGVAGTLRAAGGDILAGEQILACMETTCLFGTTGADGSFHFEIEPDADVALKTAPAPLGQPRRAAALCPIDIRDDELVDVGTLYVPDLPQGAPLGPPEADPQVLAVGDGLTLTLRRGDLTPRVGDTLVDAAARAVPPPQRCPQLVIPGEEIVAVYALHPFGARSSSPVGVSAPSDLPAGTLVHVRSIDEIQGNLSEPAIGHADGEVAATDEGEGIYELSWLVISRPM